MVSLPLAAMLLSWLGTYDRGAGQTTLSPLEIKKLPSDTSVYRLLFQSTTCTPSLRDPTQIHTWLHPAVTLMGLSADSEELRWEWLSG
ncbi:hypothetical protein B0I37DRAFT_369011 [Chaetomium sp. MPI-CAGE-AT-0009]|nr:hypothetical protein B0I37DRAFT_369011 [Chaetomium sp. MPI-CAGE-AT-0009]